MDKQRVRPEIERARQIAQEIKATIPLNPDISHSDAFTDSEAVSIIAGALVDWAYEHGAIY
jgi:hypothetical protein